MFFISSPSSPFNDFLFYKEREREREIEIFSNSIVCITIYIIVVDVIIPTTKKNEETKTYVSDLFLDLRTQIFPRHSITSCHTDTLQNCATTGITTATTITHSFSIFQFFIQISLLTYPNPQIRDFVVSHTLYPPDHIHSSSYATFMYTYIWIYI